MAPSSLLLANWGKLGDAVYPHRAHPALCHMLDVGHVAQMIFRECLQTQLQGVLAVPFGDDVTATGRILGFACALHDLGKLSPEFQSQSPAASRALAQLGLPFRTAVAKTAGHGEITTALLPELLCEVAGWDFNVSNAVAEAVGGHHGQFATSQTVNRIAGEEELRRNNKFQVWHTLRLEAVTVLGAALGIRFPVPIYAKRVSVEWLVLLAGLTTVSDWIGSIANHFPRVGCQPDWQTYVDSSLRQAVVALSAVGWTGWKSPARRRSFGELFPALASLQPRPLQVEIAQLCDAGLHSTLIVVEAPMGEGKTEAAMLVADHWATLEQQRGCYFALPTMATSNQMFGRVREFLENRYHDDRVNLLLLHGRAGLSEALRELIVEGSREEPADIWDDDAPTGRGSVIASEWFTYRKRGLLAPFGVGTIDQALMAVLSTRHGFLRLFALAGKTVIIDEVHAYDIYMSTLLDYLLQWLKRVGCGVVLLSATLPARTRRRLFAAWEGVRSCNESEGDAVTPAYPRVSWATPSGIESRGFPAVRCQRVSLLWLSASDSLGEYLRNALEGGGCAAVICNTVTSAQNLYRELRQFFSTDELELFHARFPFGARQARESRVLHDFGKADPGTGSTGVRSRRVLVATQVIEQSLDIDFDLMISELAPVDLLLQRAGRLHRHARERPSGLAVAQLAILGPAVSLSEIPDWGLSGRVYWPHALLRTWLAIRDRRLIVIPDDLEELIEAVYDDRAPPAGLGPLLEEEWHTTHNELEESERDSVLNAEGRRIRRPSAEIESLRDVWNRPRNYDEDAAGAALRPLTRESDESVVIACFLRTPEGLRAEVGGDVIRLDIPLSSEVVEVVLRQTVTLSNQRLVQLVKGASSVPTTWQSNSWLSRVHLVVFDPVTRRAEFGELGWDDELGILFLPPLANR